jgi:hypothetical protein
LSAELIKQVRTLTQLHSFNCSIDAWSLVQLLQPLPHGKHLQWTTRLSRSILTDESMALCASSLPQLFKIQIGPEDALSSLNGLAGIPSLRRLAINGYKSVPLLSVLLSHIIKLHLSHVKQTSVVSLLAYFPRLQDLTFAFVDEFDTLTFLQPLQSSLRTLTLKCFGQKRCPSSAVMQLAGFQLTRLVLHRSFDGDLTGEQLAVLQVPSTLLPSLKTFVYCDPGFVNECKCT